MKLGIAGLVRRGYAPAKSRKRKLPMSTQTQRERHGGVQEVGSTRSQRIKQLSQASQRARTSVDSRAVPVGGSAVLKRDTNYPSGVDQGTGIQHVGSLGGGLNTPATTQTYKPVGQPTAYGGVESQGVPSSQPKDIALTSTVDRSQRSVVPMNARKSGLSDILRSAGKRRRGRYG